MPFSFGVVESQSVQQKIDAAIETSPRLGELYEGLKWFLSRSPRAGYIANSNPEKFLIKANGFKQINVPGVLILYSFSGTEVLLEAIKIIRFNHND